jgi:hypothetical protein
MVADGYLEVAYFNSITVVGSNGYVSTQEVTYLGSIVIEKYAFNRLTLVVLSLNPVVYFEYRNVYVMPHNNTRYEVLWVRNATYN